MSDDAAKTAQDWLSRCSRYLAWGAGALLLASTVPVLLEVLLRNLTGAALIPSFEITGYLFAIAVAFGYAYALTTRAHVRIDIARDRFPRVVRIALDLVAQALLTAAVLTVTWYAWDTVAASWSFQGASALGAVSNSTLKMPLIVPQGLWALGWSWFSVVCAIVLFRAVRLATRRRLQELDALVGAVQPQEEAVREGGAVEPQGRGRR